MTERRVHRSKTDLHVSKETSSDIFFFPVNLVIVTRYGEDSQRRLKILTPFRARKTTTLPRKIGQEMYYYFIPLTEVLCFVIGSDKRFQTLTLETEFSASRNNLELKAKATTVKQKRASQ